MIPKDHIEEIRKKYLSSDKDYVLPSLNKSVNRIGKAFPKYGSFLMEFIQNADDANSISMVIEIVDNTVRVFNDGRSFSTTDVDSLCRVGMSSKTPKDYIGYLGVGFKSVFIISDSSEVHSGGYSFRFDKNSWSGPEQIPWQVVPIWIENTSLSLPSGVTTAFNITVKSPDLLEKLRQETKPEHISNRMLLFLRNLKKIEVRDVPNKTMRKIKKSLEFYTKDYEVYSIQEHLDGELKCQERWLVFRSRPDVPLQVKEDQRTIEWEREGVDKREVVVAFRLDGKDNLMVEEKGTAHIGVFSFLPLKEVPSGLNFLLQADFLTTPGKTELVRDCLWNDWLAREIYKLIIENCIPIFVKDERWKFNFTEILYSPWGGHELFENNIKKPLREYLEKEPCLIGSDGSVIKLGNALEVDVAIRELVNDDDLRELFPDKKPLGQNCKIPSDFKWRVTKGPSYDSQSGLNFEMQKLLKLKAQRKDSAFIRKLYSKLKVGFAESTIQRSPFKYQEMAPTDNWSLVQPNRLYIRPKGLSIPKEASGYFNILNPELALNPEIIALLKLMGAEELTEEHIQYILKIKEIPAMNKNWPTLPDSEKMERIKLCKKLWETRQIDGRDLEFLTLKTKSERWVKPSEAIFSKEYEPEHQIERIVLEKRLLDLPLEFVSAEFIQNQSANAIRDWSRFFRELGVEKKLESDSSERRNIVERIGMLTALQFERSKGRNPTPVDHLKLGYDIESKSASDERYIEVKSNSSPEPEISITANEHRTLREKREGYYVYVIRQALQEPVLDVTTGYKLLEIPDMRIQIPFNSWWNNAKEEEYRP